MPIISGAAAPTFNAPQATCVGLASPSRGAKETCAWRATIAPGAAGHEHSVEREEIFVALAGAGRVTIEGEVLALGAGDALVVPAHTPFKLANPGDEPLELVCVLPVGARAYVAGEEPFTPPWAE
ncbi:cupin domain-containing protein [Actinomadura barringtoniae]|uniref:Cupin domain-containing protein n=1 Tax=Actinomadura barringtoniae TaxID=1427535 RepID=A0A939T9T3_9ACTN|nr:cupin domain-containing protein [Actinomadura barringtoniae]MBO2451732.1 cupin domain-containing protein [Actinomadura barringtoniae]